MLNFKLKRVVNPALLVAGVFSFGMIAQQAAAGQNDVAIVHSYSSKISWVVNQSAGFRKELGDQYQYTEFDMDTKRIEQSKFQAVADDILAQIKELKPKVVYVTDDNALKLVGRYVDPAIPVVFSGVNANLREDYPWLLKSKNITGVLERPLIKRNLLETMRAFNINAKKILVLMDTSLTAQYFFKLDLHSKEHFKVKGAEVDVFRAGEFETWQQKILAAKDQGYDMLLLAGSFALKEGDQSISAVDVAKWISQNSPVPPFTSHLQQIGKGLLIGGLQLNGELMGSDAAEIAKSLVGGNKQASEIFPKTQTAGNLMYSKAEIAKQGLNISKKYQDHVILVE